MFIHVVEPGESVYTIARKYQVPMSLVIAANGLEPPDRLVAGQALVIRIPEETYTVRPGETLEQIAARSGLSSRQLLRRNPALAGENPIFPGQTLVLSYQEEEKLGPLLVNGYAYPYVDKELLRATLPYLSALTPFTYGFTPQGELVPLEDEALLSMAAEGGAAGLMHLSTLTEEGGFSNELGHIALTDSQVQDTLVRNLLRTLLQKGYQGLDVDFEYIPAQDAAAYAAFIRRLSRRLNPLGRPVIVALAPKTSREQAGLLYEGHSYGLIGAAANGVLLMTYEWGYAYGPPMAVAPLPNVRRVVEYALEEIHPGKIWLGIPNYGYDWPLPFVSGQSRAKSISMPEAVALAWKYGVSISYSQQSQAPWFRYTDEAGVLHEVWFEDARSIRAKLELIREYGLFGAGYWNLMRPFPQNWQVLDALYSILPD